jgi:hypothetical protein
MKGSSLADEGLLKQRLTELGSIASWAPHILSGLERFIRTASDYEKPKFHTKMIKDGR